MNFSSKWISTLYLRWQQWPAVSIQFGLIKVPPHGNPMFSSLFSKDFKFWNWSLASQGHEPSIGSIPFMIRANSFVVLFWCNGLHVSFNEHNVSFSEWNFKTNKKKSKFSPLKWSFDFWKQNSFSVLQISSSFWYPPSQFSSSVQIRFRDLMHWLVHSPQLDQMALIDI